MKVSAKVAAIGFIVSAVMGYHNAASASETREVTRTVTVYNLKDDNAKLYETVKAICADKSVKLSDKARVACETDTFPKLTKSLRFRNAGIGAEFNTLAAQR